MRSTVRLLAIVASAVIAVSFTLFALDQSGHGRDIQVQKLEDPEVGANPREAIASPGPPAPVERLREEKNSSAREVADDGNDLLASPFKVIVGFDNVWAQRLVPAALGLLLFGLGGLVLANWLPERRTEHTDWREAAG